MVQVCLWLDPRMFLDQKFIPDPPCQCTDTTSMIQAHQKLPRTDLRRKKFALIGSRSGQDPGLVGGLLAVLLSLLVVASHTQTSTDSEDAKQVYPIN